MESAWLCRKSLRFFPDNPAFVLIYKAGMLASEATVSQKLEDALELPGSIFLVEMDSESAARKLTIVVRVKIAPDALIGN